MLLLKSNFQQMILKVSLTRGTWQHAEQLLCYLQAQCIQSSEMVSETQ